MILHHIILSDWQCTNLCTNFISDSQQKQMV